MCFFHDWKIVAIKKWGPESCWREVNKICLKCGKYHNGIDRLDRNALRDEKIEIERTELACKMISERES